VAGALEQEAEVEREGKVNRGFERGFSARRRAWSSPLLLRLGADCGVPAFLFFFRIRPVEF
jgi:hypothetical protein